MEVLDLTGDREMYTVEKAQEIAGLIRENALTLKKAILKTKTYNAEVAKIIASRDEALLFISQLLWRRQRCLNIWIFQMSFPDFPSMMLSLLARCLPIV